VLLDFNIDARAWAPGQPLYAVEGDASPVGTGKTRRWINNIAVPLIAAGIPCVLAVPRHKLGDEIVNHLSAIGITSEVYRGREADDPDTSGVKMCRDLKRAELITEALNNVASNACKRGTDECQFFNICGYQAQRHKKPDAWIVPHQLLFRERPNFIPQPGSLAIDESFWNASLHGIDKPYLLWLDDLEKHRDVPVKSGTGNDIAATNDLMTLSQKLARKLRNENDGLLRRDIFSELGIVEADLRDALRCEWRRKKELNVSPGIPLQQVAAKCHQIAAHNQMVARLARFWELAIKTITSPDDQSPWLNSRKEVGDGKEPAVFMNWSDDVHQSWAADTWIMDGTMSVSIVQRFFPGFVAPVTSPVAMPHTSVRQITDRAMALSMFVGEFGSKRTNIARVNNVQRAQRLIEVRARDVAPGRMLVICQLGLETALEATHALPSNVELAHFGNVSGENRWSDVTALMVIGRTEPAVWDVERTARALFGVVVDAFEPDDKGLVRWPTVTRGLRMRDGSGVAVENSQHPDWRVEEVRWQICEAQLIQAIGRGRGIKRTAADPLLVDVITNICLPLEVDETTTWDGIQPSLAEIMRARGAVPLNYADMADCYPDLFGSRSAAESALRRENPRQMSIDSYYSIDICSGFSSLGYRRGSRGPWSRLLYDAACIDPVDWLKERLDDVSFQSQGGK
jgi:putative DNA primase/helicase